MNINDDIYLNILNLQVYVKAINEYLVIYEKVRSEYIKIVEDNIPECKDSIFGKYPKNYNKIDFIESLEVLRDKEVKIVGSYLDTVGFPKVSRILILPTKIFERGIDMENELRKSYRSAIREKLYEKLNIEKDRLMNFDNK